jgi:hypothetical protein
MGIELTSEHSDNFSRNLWKDHRGTQKTVGEPLVKECNPTGPRSLSKTLLNRFLCALCAGMAPKRSERLPQ